FQVHAVPQDQVGVLRFDDIAQRWLVTSEGAFSYLAQDYQLKEVYLWRSTPMSKARRNRSAG
ncbi:hypothetical protein ISX56_35355, partial [Serratia ureilytica]|nr:hypothetical protein [Serratia ureilytica]